ncbi:hypothetical protein RRF57_012795 [Xylaria bambusicola]|uniref:Mid2 domain-containing protein n=1 Tax=Xylaria bambusicola TaxID=326684 RepID=A0AAN7V002_9PEZI
MFFLWLTSNSPNDDGDDPESVTSHYFNITDTADAQDSASTSSQPSQTALSTHLSTTSSPSTTTITGTSDATGVISETPTTSPMPSGLSTGAQAGIGVGVGLVGLAIIVASFLLARRSRRKHSYQAPNQTEIETRGDFPGGEKPSSQHAPSGPHEMQSSPIVPRFASPGGHGWSPPVELSTTRE